MNINITMYTDGASRGNPGPSGIGVVIMDKEETIYYKDFIGMNKTNNEAEYIAIIEGLVMVDELSWNNKEIDIDIYLDSKLVVNQLNGTWKVKDYRMRKFHSISKELINKFNKVSIEHIPRKENIEADKLANEALDEVLKER